MAEDFPRHDQLPEAELLHEQSLTRTMLEAQYFGDLTNFRANVISKLLANNALNDSGGWAVFYDDSADSDTHSALAVHTPRTILLLLQRVSVSGALQFTPTMRLIVNELVKAPDSDKFIVKDYTADWENDAWYHIDVVDPTTDTPLTTYGTLFGVNDGTLTIQGHNQTPNITFQEGGLTSRLPAGETLVASTPLGRYTCLEDRIHALAEMQAVYRLIHNNDPIFAQSSH